MGRRQRGAACWYGRRKKKKKKEKKYKRLANLTCKTASSFYISQTLKSYNELHTKIKGEKIKINIPFITTLPYTSSVIVLKVQSFKLTL